MTENDPTLRQIRAQFDERTIRVYQAYSPAIAEPAIAAGRFVDPFKRERMTWIKPSFTWMMYRCGWAQKPDQERVLAIDLSRTGFETALASSCLAHFDRDMHADAAAWKATCRESPVRIQWDPERSLRLGPLAWRAIQVGLGGSAVDQYVDEWIQRIEDITPLVREIHALVRRDELEQAEKLRPRELPYPVPSRIAARIGCSSSATRTAETRPTIPTSSHWATTV